VNSMKKRIFILKSILLGGLLVLILSCAPAPEGLSNADIASTYAAQTLTALPTKTTTPEPTETPTPRPTATPLPVIGPVGPVDFPENVNPLTGLMVEDPTILDRRPVFVKVANYPARGRPHAGLSSADMVFEYYIGAGGNRFMGLYYGQDAPKIGPIRSGRLIDPHIVSLYEGILGIESAYVTVLNYIYDFLGDRVINGRSTCPAICDDGRYIVISVFGDSEEMTNLYDTRGDDNQRYLLEGMAFDLDVPEGGDEGHQANIRYAFVNRGDWRFDQESGRYLRWIEDTTRPEPEMIPLVDSETDEQLAFSNVAVIFANHTELAPTLHEIDIWDNLEGQRAVIFRDGQAFDLTWATPSNDQPIQFWDETGEVFPLKPGNTWVVILGENSLVTEEEGLWTFNFLMP
jgi:hypothetical protein